MTARLLVLAAALVAAPAGLGAAVYGMVLGELWGFVMMVPVAGGVYVLVPVADRVVRDRFGGWRE